MSVSTASTIIHYTDKSSASDGPPAQNTWHVPPHSHSTVTRRTRPSVKYWQTSGSYTYFSCSSNGTVTVCVNTGAFLGVFAKLRKVTTSVMSVRPSVYSSACNSARNGRTFHKIRYPIFFENMSRKSRLYWNLTRITGTWYEGLCTVMKYLSRGILFRMRNVPGKIQTHIL